MPDRRYASLRPQLLPTLLAVLALGSSAPREIHAGQIHLALPPELQSHTDDLPVTERKRFFLPKRPADKAVVFGTYRVDRYRAGFTERTQYGTGGGSLSAFTEKSWRKYSFELRTADGARLPVDCVQRKESHGFSLSDGDSKTDFDVPSGQEIHCSLYPGDGVVWELEQRARRGTLTGPNGASFDLQPSNHAEGTRFRIPTPVGFFFFRGEKAVGAVEVLNKGRFLLSQELSPSDRTLVAGASAALLLASSLE